MIKRALAILASLAIITMGCAVTPGQSVKLLDSGYQVANASYKTAKDNFPEAFEKSEMVDLGECKRIIEEDQGYDYTICTIGEFQHVWNGVMFVIQVIDSDLLDANLDGEVDAVFLLMLNGDHFMLRDILGGEEAIKWVSTEATMIAPGKTFGELVVWAKTMDIPDGWDPATVKNPWDPTSAGEEDDKEF